MVLAAGRGERMRPLSDVLPKPALPLPSGPVVSSALRLAAAVGANRVVVNVWHLGDRMEAALRRTGIPPDTITISAEPRLMGTAGGLALARERGLLGSAGAVLVLNGDSLYDLVLEPLLDRFSATDDLVSLGLIPHPNPARWSRVLLDPAGRVAAIRRTTEAAHNERHPSHYPGVMVVSREALDALPVEPGSTPARLWEPARADGRLGGALLAGSWFEVGTPPDYMAAVQASLSGANAVDPSSEIDDSAVVTSSYLGHAVRIGAASTVSHSAAVAGVRIGRGARVVRSILVGPVEIGDSELVDDEVRVADW